MQTTKEHGKVYFAFPGMGKTTYARSHANFLDLDFGNFRSAHQVSRDEDSSLLLPFSRLMKYYYRDGFNILTNDPRLIPLVKQFAERDIIMVLPKDRDALVQRVAARERARHVNSSFPLLLADSVDAWVDDWESVARKYNIPVMYNEYFEEVPNAV